MIINKFDPALNVRRDFTTCNGRGQKQYTLILAI